MLSFLKKKKKNKTPTPPRQPPQGSSNLRRHISLPLIDTGTQVDLSPKILKPDQSLLNYSSSLQDSDNGYSTVRDAIIHIPSHRNNSTTSNNRHEDDEDSINSRPLPAVPGKGQRIERSLSDSTFTNVTQDDDILSIQTDSYIKTKSKQLNDSSDINTPIYAVINKESKRKRGTTKGTHPQQDTNMLQKPLRATPITETVTCEVHDPLLLSPVSDIVQSTSIPSDVFELSNTEESCDLSCDMSYDESLDQDSSQRPSSPLIVPTHRPPPSPNPRSNPKPQQKKNVISPSEHGQSSKEMINPSGSSKSRSSSYSPDLSKLTDLPIYNLNQSLTDGYIMSRTDRDGKIEYFTATPILNSPTIPLSLSNQSHHRYGLPLISSTPMKNENTTQTHSNNSIPVQSNPQVSIPTVTVPIQHQSPIPVLQHSPLPHSPIPVLPHSPTPPHSPVPVLLHSPNPVLPQLLPHPLHNTVASSFNVPSSSLPQQQLHKRLSTSQPLLNKPNLAGLTEINKILLHHQHTRQRTPENVPREDSVVMETDVVMDTSSIHQTDNNGRSMKHETKDESTRGVSGSHGSNEIELMKRENDSLRETINHLTHQMTPVEHKTETVTADELVNNTPLKLKRVLDTLMCENEQKDTQIQTLKMEQLSLKKLCDELKTKNDILDKSHKEVLGSSINERQALNTSMTKVYNENKILQQKFKTSSDKLKITKKDYDRKVDVMKEEIRLLRNEMGRFQSSVHTIDYQYQQQQIHSVSLDEHKQAVTRLERLLHQTMKDSMQISPAVSVQHTAELSVISQLKQDNQRLAIELAEIKGRLSIVIEECTILRKQSRDYEGTIFSLNKDLKYSQAREMEALKILNESINGRTTKKSKLNYTVDSSQSDIEQLLKKQDGAAVRQEAGQQTLDKFHNHDQRNLHQKKSREKMKELRSELTRKDQALEEMQYNKRIAEKQRDLLWQSRTTDGIFRH